MLQEKISVQVIEGRYVVRGTQEVFDMFDRGIETKAQDMLDMGKDGKAKLVLIKKTESGIELVSKPVGSNLANYDTFIVRDTRPNVLYLSKEDSEHLCNNLDSLITIELSSGARFTEKDLDGLPKEAHYLIYKLDSNGARKYNAIQVRGDDNYKKYGIKSQIERGLARTIVLYLDNKQEFVNMSVTERLKHSYRMLLKPVEFQPNGKEEK